MPEFPSPSANPLPDLFARTERTPIEHFKLYFFAAVLRVLSWIAMHTPTAGTLSVEEEVFTRFPFLLAYTDELAHYGLDGMTLDEAGRCWTAWLRQWEMTSAQPLPLAVLRQTGRDSLHVVAGARVGGIEVKIIDRCCQRKEVRDDVVFFF